MFSMIQQLTLSSVQSSLSDTVEREIITMKIVFIRIRTRHHRNARRPDLEA